MRRPAGRRGAALTPPTAEGGALRSQDMRTTGDPTGLDGAILRVNPDTGAAMAGNPNAGSPDPNARRIVAYGLRNPFRIAVRPGTNEIWTGDVGWGSWEEINRLPNPTGAVRNFGWPCYEGTGPDELLRHAEPEPLRDALQPGRRRPRGAVLHVPPQRARRARRGVRHRLVVDLRRRLHAAGSSFPAEYDGALFFADYSRDCIWAMLARRERPARPRATARPSSPAPANPVDLQFGPGGDLYYVDLERRHDPARPLD